MERDHPATPLFWGLLKVRRDEILPPRPYFGDVLGDLGLYRAG